MKVKALLSKMMMSSYVDYVIVKRDGHIVQQYDGADLRLNDYGKIGNETVKTFAVYGGDFVINI